MAHWIYYVLLAVILIGGLYLTLLNIPGLWVMVVATVVYALLTHFAYAGLKTLVAALVLAGLAELIDFFAGAAGAKKAGASRRGLVGAIIGGIAGGILLTFFLPIIFTIVGICVGTFIGAIVGELWGGTQVTRSLKIGWGAAWGRLLGIITKLLFGCVILATVLIAGRPPIHWRKTATVPLPVPIKTPATSPAKA